MRVSANTAAARAVVPVTITSDLMCPWCWVGLRKLQQASEVAKVDVDITWKPFLLRPDMPVEGKPKSGTPDSRVPSRLKAAGKAVGIDFTGLTDTTPNTIDFHATMKYLLDNKQDQTPFQEQVFDAYFTQGIFPDQSAMLKLAEKIGVAEYVQTLYQNEGELEKYREAIMVEARDASRRGVHGVPSFAFGSDTKEAFSGAQPVDTFVRHLKYYAVGEEER